MSTNDTRIRVTIEDQAGDEVAVTSGGALTVTSGGTGASADQIQGTAASDAAVVGNPLLNGGRASSATPTAVSTNGDAVATWHTLNGAVVVAANTATTAQADGATNTPTGWANNSATMLFTPTYKYAHNGSTWDRVRNNTDLTILASAARTATLQSSDITNYNGRGMHLVIDVTAASATPSVVFTIQGKDALSGKYYTILASSAITGISTTVLKVHPGITAAANASASDLLPRTWRIDATHADADSITYSVGASVIV